MANRGVLKIGDCRPKSSEAFSFAEVEETKGSVSPEKVKIKLHWRLDSRVRVSKVYKGHGSLLEVRTGVD